MRVVFLGTPAFAIPSLEGLVNGGYEVVAVVCQPDREKDRKGRTIEGALKSRAKELNLPVYQFEKIRREGVETLKELKPDIMITCAYGQILSQEILDIAPYGVINVHGSLLPAYRGSAPIQRVLINGEKSTGITIMKTDIGMDSGAMLDSVEVEINSDDYLDGLYEKMSVVGAELLLKVLPDYISGKLIPVAQDESRVTYAPPVKKEETHLDFSLSAERVRNIIRGCGYGVCAYNGALVKIYEADLADGEAESGEIIAAKKHTLTVACGKGALNLKTLQISGKKKMATADFLNGVKIAVGERMEKID